MPSIDALQWLALKSRIDTLVTIPTMPRFDPGAIVTPPSDATGPLPFITLSDVRNDKDRIAITSAFPHVSSGTLMLAINWPVSRTVTHTQLVEMAGQIAAHFPADTCMQYGLARLRVVRDSDALAPYVEGSYRIALVRVFWSTM